MNVPAEDSLEDFVRNYSGTVARIHPLEGPTFISHIRNIETASKSVFNLSLQEVDKEAFLNSKGTALPQWARQRTVANKMITDIEPFMPDTGLYNLDDGTVVEMSQVSRRQWKLGWSRDTVHIKFLEPINAFIERYTQKEYPNHLNPGVVYRVCDEPLDYTFRQASELVLSGERIGAAFSREFAIVNSLADEDFLLMYHNDIVGKVYTNGKIDLLGPAETLIGDLLQDAMGG